MTPMRMTTAPKSIGTIARTRLVSEDLADSFGVMVSASRPGDDDPGQFRATSSRRWHRCER